MAQQPVQRRLLAFEHVADEAQVPADDDCEAVGVDELRPHHHRSSDAAPAFPGPFAHQPVTRGDPGRFDAGDGADVHQQLVETCCLGARDGLRDLTDAVRQFLLSAHSESGNASHHFKPGLTHATPFDARSIRVPDTSTRRGARITHRDGTFATLFGVFRSMSRSTIAYSACVKRTASPAARCDHSGSQKPCNSGWSWKCTPGAPVFASSTSQVFARGNTLSSKARYFCALGVRTKITSTLRLRSLATAFAARPICSSAPFCNAAGDSPGGIAKCWAQMLCASAAYAGSFSSLSQMWLARSSSTTTISLRTALRGCMP